MAEEIINQTFSADGSSDEVSSIGGMYLFSHRGGGGSNYGGGTIKLQWSTDGGLTWADVADTDHASAETLPVMTGRGLLYRVNLASSTGPTIRYTFCVASMGDQYWRAQLRAAGA